MNKTMISALTAAMTMAILITGMFATTTAILLPNVAFAQKNSTSSPNTPTPTPTPTNSTGTNASFLTYQNTTSGIKIQYPSNWTGLVLTKTTGGQVTGRGVSFAVLFNQRNNISSNNFLAKLNATALSGIPENMTLKSMADRVIGNYRHFLNNFQMQSYTNATLAGNNAIKIVYTYSDVKNNMFNGTDIAIKKNDKLYVIQYYYYTKSPKQQEYSQTLQKMVDSFQIIK
jgi:PsbP-like protein